MKTIVFSSLAGGQGKTTCSYILAKRLSRSGCKVLVIDADPQHTITLKLGVEVSPSDPTLLEVFKGAITAIDACQATEHEGIWIIPADLNLHAGDQHLAASGASAKYLRMALKKVDGFDFAIIDAPPRRSQISQTALGAANYVFIPVEARDKGVESAVTTLELIASLMNIEEFPGEIGGIVPFRDRWFGNNRSKDCQAAIDRLAQIEEAHGIAVLPSILETEAYHTAINKGQIPSDLKPELELAFDKIEEVLGVRRPNTQAA